MSAAKGALSQELTDRLRTLAPQVLGALVRRYGQFDIAEDAVQEALLAATQQWPADGVPDNPRGWLITVAARRLTDQVRQEQARRRREDVAASMAVPEPSALNVDHDDTLRLLLLCCHTDLSPLSQVALTLRAVGGLRTAEIAHAFLVPEATMAQRISRAKQTIKVTGAIFEPPSKSDLGERMAAVLHVLYLIFNEGYASTSGDRLQRPELTLEAIRLTRQVVAVLPSDGEAAGLLALMLLTDARRPARSQPDGTLIPLDEQDRSRWNREFIAEGIELITDSLQSTQVGSYQLQAAIAAVHDEAERSEDTDWAQILALYELLMRLAPNPVVSLNHAVAVAMANGPADGLAALASLDADTRLAQGHRLYAVRAHLLDMTGDPAAREFYLEAARRTTSTPEQQYLRARAARIDDLSEGSP